MGHNSQPLLHYFYFEATIALWFCTYETKIFKYGNIWVHSVVTVFMCIVILYLYSYLYCRALNYGIEAWPLRLILCVFNNHNQRFTKIPKLLFYLTFYRFAFLFLPFYIYFFLFTNIFFVCSKWLLDVGWCQHSWNDNNYNDTFACQFLNIK
jgi:hypothetical protein